MQKSLFHAAFLLLLGISPALSAEIYKWVDDQGQVHYGDGDSSPAEAEKADIGPVNSLAAPAPQTPQAPAASSETPTPSPPLTAADWAAEHCQLRIRILYTERSFIPCVPTDEVPVYLCEEEAPRGFRRYFGRRYRYEDRESECGPEVYEGEIVYLKNQ